MVTSDRPAPGFTAGDLLKAIRNGPPKCAVCDAEILGAKTGVGKDRDLRWCEPCHSFQKVYRGPQRQKLCGSCFNNADGKCAAMMYQDPEGKWFDRYNQSEHTYYREGGAFKDVKPVKPLLMKTPQYDCECYEHIEPGETRESIRLNDPLRFYDKTRFFD